MSGAPATVDAAPTAAPAVVDKAVTTNGAAAPVNTNPLAWLGDGANDNDLTEYVKNKGWKDPLAAVTSYRALESAKGGAVTVPADDAPEAAWNAYYAKLGRPEKAEAYNLDLPEDADADFVGGIRTMFHKNGVSQKSAAGLAKEYVALQAAITERNEALFQQQSQAQMKELEGQWGTTGAEMRALAKKGGTAMNLSDAVLDALERQIGTKQFVSEFVRIGKMIGEHAPAGQGQGSTTPSAASAQAQIDQLKLDNDFIGKLNSGDPTATKKWNDLFALANP